MASRYERAQMNPSNSPANDDSTSPESAVTAYSPTGTTSHDAPFLRDDESCDLENERDNSAGPATSKAGTKADKEKRKRSRVTPEQLVHLERYFLSDRSPTAARRREIGEMLGMQERQTQIWFQNRRAKAKLQDGKLNAKRSSSELASEASPGLSAASEVDLYDLIHEDEPVTVIPCSDLTVGSWRRIASSANKHDLVAYVCEAKRCLTWFIHSGGYGFKMDIPFNIVLNTEFNKIGAQTGLATFILSQPPNFYLEHLSPPLRDGSVPRTWKRCADWTEGRQASQVLRHTIIGSDSELNYVLRNLRAQGSMPDVRLREPSYRSERMVASPMELPAPPLAGLATAGFPLSGMPIKHPQYPVDQIRKRPSYDAQQLSAFALDTADMRPAPHSAPAATFPQNGYIRQVSQTTAPNFDSAVYSTNDASHHPYQGSRISNAFVANPITHTQPTTPYTTHPESYSNPRALQPFQREDVRSPHTVLYPTPSPPLLTTPYNPDPTSDRLYSNAHHPYSKEMSGMPGIMYEADEDLRCRQSH